MRVYNENRLFRVFCNQCGKGLRVENGILKEGCFLGRQSFNYFSEKDGVIHEFELCESCYDGMIAKFRIPVSQKEETEFL